MSLKIPDFHHCRVLIVGDLMLDRYWHGGTSRISPEAPVPVVHIREQEERAGGAGNVALNMASLGAGVTLCGLVGEDEAAGTLTAMLEAKDIACDFDTVADKPTIVKLRVISRQQQLIRLDFEEDFFEQVPAGLLQRFMRHLQDCDLVVLSDYAKGTLADPQPFIQAAKAAGKPVLIDPKSQDLGLYAGASLITPNLPEFEAAAGKVRDEEELVAKGQAMLERFDLETLLVTRGEHGMTLLQRQQPPFHLPTQAREVYDVTGAGDTVIAVLAAALAAGEELTRAVTLANLAAGIVVGRLGTSSVTVADLQQALHQQHMSGAGVIGEDNLGHVIREAQQAGEKVVMTNGCFDILHAGHVRYLQQARKLGDVLVIAVNDDDSVRRLKGDKRPVNTLEQRMEVLAALDAVDYVVPFSEDTPERLICHLLPDLLVKGGDYRPEQIAGGRCVQQNGGEVVILDFHEGHSTSRIIDTIVDSNT